MFKINTREKVLRFIERYYAERGFSPSVREITKGVGLKSTSSTAFHIRALLREGRLTKMEGAARTIIPSVKSTGATKFDVLYNAVVEAKDSIEAYVKLCNYLSKMQLGEVMDTMEWMEMLNKEV